MNQTSRSDKHQLIFSTGIVVAVSVLALLVFFPFLNVLALSAILAVLLDPVQKAILKKVRVPSLAAGITLVALIVVILVPLVFIVHNIVSEAENVYVSMAQSPALTSDQVTGWIENKVSAYVPNFALDTRGYLSAFSSWIVSKLSGVFSGTIDFAFKLALSFVALFYFLRDGEVLKKHITALIPWGKKRNDYVVDSIKTSIKSVVMGSLAVALVQGLLTGISFSITGVPNGTLWGTLAAICALVPGVGTAIVWIPAVIYLFVTSPVAWPWITQLIISVFLVGLIDNFLAPMIMEKGIHIHPLLILFSVLGGIQLFGPEGFLLGPLVLSLLFVLIRLFRNEADSGVAPTSAVQELSQELSPEEDGSVVSGAKI